MEEEEAIELKMMLLDEFMVRNEVVWRGERRTKMLRWLFREDCSMKWGAGFVSGTIGGTEIGAPGRYVG